MTGVYVCEEGWHKLNLRKEKENQCQMAGSHAKHGLGLR